MFILLVFFFFFFGSGSAVVFPDEGEDGQGEAGQRHQQVEDDGEVGARIGGCDPGEQEVEPDAEEVHHLRTGMDKVSELGSHYKRQVAVAGAREKSYQEKFVKS